MSLVELGLGLDLQPFIGKLATAEGALKRIQVQAQSSISLRASLDTSSIWPALETVKKTLAKEKLTLKVATEFYQVGSGNSISATSLKESVLKNVQRTVSGSDEYKIKIGTAFQFDKSATRQIRSIIKELDASIERFNAAKAATASASRPADVGSARQRLVDLATNSESKGGVNSAELRRLQNEAAKAGIKTSSTGAKELRKELAEEFLKAGEDAIKGLAKGLAENPTSVLRAGSKLVDTVIKGFKDDLGIRSPSKKTADEIGKPMAEGIGKGFVDGMVTWERRMAASIRQALGNAIQQGMSRDQAARGALMDFGRDAGATIATSLGKALKQGLASSVAPALKGGLLGGTGGFATGGLVGAATAAGGAIKQAVMPAMATFGYSNIPEKLGMLGKGSMSLVTGQASEAFNQFLQSSVDSVLNAALSTGGQGALLGAAGVAGVAGLTGLAKGASGSLVGQAVESIKNRILGTAAQQAQAQAQLPGSTAGAVSAPIENAGNIMGVLQNATSNAAKAILDFAKGLSPGKAKERAENFAWWVLQAAEQFSIVKKDMQVLSGKVRNTWAAFSNNTPPHLLPPQPVPGTGLVRGQDVQLSSTIGRTALDWRRSGAFGVTGGLIGPEEAGRFDPGYAGAWMAQERKSLQGTFGKPGEWRIVDEVSGIWKRIKTDSELAAERMAQIRAAITSSESWTNRGPLNNRTNERGPVTSTFNSYTGNIGAFNPFEPAFYRGPRSAAGYSMSGDSIPGARTTLGGTFGGSRRNDYYGKDGDPPPPPNTTWRRATQEAPGALALRNAPVEFFTSFREAEQLLALVEQRLGAVGKAFDRLGAKSQIQVDQGIRQLAVSLRAIEIGFQRSEIGVSDLRAAWYNADRELAGLSNKSAEVQNLARAFENLGIQSRDAIDSIQDQRNIDLAYINNTLGKYHPEAIKAQNARDIQQMQRANDFVRTAQGAAGFGGFRGREIGNEVLNQAQQRSVLANAVREMREYQETLKKTETNAKTYERVQNALNAEIRDAERAWRVLNGEASDGERIAVVARNAWGTILDDFKNLVPQLLVFAVAYNLILQRVMTTPAAVIQAAASFDRLETSISSYLSATRGMGDTSGVIGELKQVALDLGIGFDKAASSYLRFAAATQGTTLEGREVDITRTIATAGRNQGLSGEQIDRASVALTQILSKGRVQSEELRGQLAEQLPGALQVAARAFGVTTKELYRMVEAGQIAGDEFVDKFTKQLVAEGASVNQLAGSFSNVSEQLGSSVQALAASAGQPFLAPLTVGLQALNALVKTFIPLGGVLSALFITIASSAAKSYLKIDSWRKGLGQIVGMALNREGVVGGGLLGVDGKPLQKPDRSAQFKAGMAQARQGVQQLFSIDKGKLADAFDGLKPASGTMGEMSKAAGQISQGLKQATGAAAGLGTTLKAALVPALKFYLVMEAVGLLIKGMNGELSALGNEAKRSNAILNPDQKKSQELNFGQKILSALNVGQNITDFGTYLDSGKIAQNSAKMSQAILKDKDLIKKTANDVLYVEKQAYEERQKLNLAQTEEQRKASTERIKALNAEKEFLLKKLPKGVTPSGVQEQISINEAAIQAQRRAVERAERMGAPSGPAKERLDFLEKELKRLQDLAGLLRKVNDLRTLGLMESRLKPYEENLRNENVNSANFDAWQRKIVGFRMAISDEQLLDEEKALKTKEMLLRAATAEMKAQESVQRIKLGLIENERKLLEANLSLERQRGKLREVLAQRRVDVANAVDAPEQALAAEVQLRRVREGNQAKELQMQEQILSKDRERIAIETNLQKEQVKLQTQQLKIERDSLEIEKLKLKAALEVAKWMGSDDLRGAYVNQIEAVEKTIESTNELIGQQNSLIASVDRKGAAEKSILDLKYKELEVERQIQDAVSGGAIQLEQIKSAKQQIANKEALALEAAEKAKRLLDRQEETIQRQVDAVRSLTESQRERLQVAQEAAQAEMGLLDRMLELQQGRNEGGFFERLSKASALGASGEQEAFDIAQQRVQLMQEIQQQQISQQQLELDLKKKEIEAEQEINQLKLRGQKIEIETARIALRSKLEVMRLALSSLGDNATQEQKATFQEISKAITVLGGYNPDTPLNSQGVQQASYVDLANDYSAKLRDIDELIKQSSLTDSERIATLNEYIKAEERKIEVTKKLNKLDVSQWIGQFLDKSTELGRVFSVLTDGLTEFRSTVSQAFTDAIVNGANATDAISDAGKALAGKVVAGLVDEMFVKPMETNFFKGLQALGIGQPMSEQAQLKQSTDTATTSMDNLRLSVEALNKTLLGNGNVMQQAEKMLLKPSMDTPTYRAPSDPGSSAIASSMSAAATIGGVANMLPGTRGGPNFNDGLGAGRNHKGQDLGLDIGDPIHARRGGRVTNIFRDFGGVGDAVVVKYDNGQEGRYGHVEPSVRVGDQVSAGQRIATVTPDGQNTHLHYELRDGFGRLLEPLNAIKESLRVPAGTVSPGAASTSAALPPAKMAPLQTTTTSLGGGATLTTAGAVISPDVLAEALRKAGAAPSTSAMPASTTMFGAGGLDAATPAFSELTANATDLSAVMAEAKEVWKSASEAGNTLKSSAEGTAASISNAGQSAASTPSFFRQLNTAASSAIQLLGGIGLGIAGIQQASKGGTYNTLMGIAGVFGAISSVAGGIGKLFGGGGGGNFSGPDFTPVDSLPSVGSFNPLPSNFSIQARASGGPVQARQPYLVGEDGMEVFVPQTSGTIIPNNRLRAELAADSSADPYAATASFIEQMSVGIATPRLSNEPIRIDSRIINGVEYVTLEQLQEATQKAETRGAERGRALALSSMRNSVKTRKQLGMS